MRVAEVVGHQGFECAAVGPKHRFFPLLFSTADRSFTPAAGSAATPINVAATKTVANFARLFMVRHSFTTEFALFTRYVGTRLNMAWFTRQKPSFNSGDDDEKTVLTEGLWQKCDGCGQIIWRKTVEDNFNVCPKCEHHFRLGAYDRLKLLFDDGRFEEHDGQLALLRPAEFR